MKVFRIAMAAALAGAVAWAAIGLARVDADLGAPAGPDRLLHAIDAEPAVDATDLARARTMLRERPIDGRAFRVLGQANPDNPSFAEIAGRRAPRDRMARALLADRAFARGEVEAGMEHLDALLRVTPAVRADTLKGVARLLAHEPMQQALLARLERQPNWRPALATALLEPDTPAEPAAALLARLAAEGALLPGELDARIRLLVRLGRDAEARRAWLASLPAEQRDRDGAGIFDGGFEAPDTSGGFGWRIAPPPGLLVAYDDIDPFEGASALALVFDGRAVASPGVEQALALVPGGYRLQLASADATRAARPFAIEVACTAGGTPLLALELPRAAPAWQRSAGEFVVPDSGCTGQVLRLRYRGRSLPERLVSGTLRLDAIALNRLENGSLR